MYAGEALGNVCNRVMMIVMGKWIMGGTTSFRAGWSVCWSSSSLCVNLGGWVDGSLEGVRV